MAVSGGLIGDHARSLRATIAWRAGRSFRQSLFCVGLAVLVTALSLQAQTADDAAFGSSQQSEAALMGVLYDLKQTQDHRGTDVDAHRYSKVIEEFLVKNWDERVLDRYYRVSRPLYTTQIFIPNMSASVAPRAFGVEQLVSPSRWLVHYKGQVSPPEAGTWRFVGASDDMLAVAVNRKTVLVANRFDNPLPGVKWKPSDRDGPQASHDPLRHGDWITLKAGEIIDLDIIIGERPGGAFTAFLLIEKKGAKYEREGGGPVLPIFQVAPYDTPPVRNRRDGPPFAKGFPPWKSYQ